MIVGQTTGYPSLKLALPTPKTEQATRFGHLGHHHEEEPAKTDPKTGKKKPKNPVGLVLWGLMDVTLMAGSVFFADMIVPDPHDHHGCSHTPPPTVQTPPTAQTPQEVAKKEEPESWWKHAAELSGVATGLHLLSHVGLAGGWFLYGKSRGKHNEGEKLKDYAKVEKHLQDLAKDGGNFKVEVLGNGEFKVCQCNEPQQAAVTKPTLTPIQPETPQPEAKKNA